MLSQTLQTVTAVERVLSEMLRVGKCCIVSFPNLAFKPLREQLAREREFNRQLSSLLGEEREERRKLTAMLTHQPESKADTPSASPEARAAVRPWLWVALAVASVAAAIAQWLVYR